MKLLVTGATGAAGAEIIRVALLEPTISTVTVLTRKSLPSSIPKSDKLEVIIHKDFNVYPPTLVEQLAQHDACIWALGTPSTGIAEWDYVRITHDYPMAMMQGIVDVRKKLVARNNTSPMTELKPFRFVFVSGSGADQNEKSRILFARVKGRTEKDLKAIAAAPAARVTTYSMRPGYFFPQDPTDRREMRGTMAGIMDRILTPILRLLNTVNPGMYVPINGIAQTAIGIAMGKLEETTTDGKATNDVSVVESKQIAVLHKEWASGTKAQQAHS